MPVNPETMKKLLIIALLALASYNANAQKWFTGLAFDIKWANSGAVNNNGEDIRVNNAYGGSVSPQFGYQFSPKFMLGTRVNFLFDKSYYQKTSTIDPQKMDDCVSSSIGWDLAPFCRYKVAEFGRNGWFSIWADAHAYFGRMYPRKVEEPGYISNDFEKQYIYGIQAMPAVGFRINEHSTLFVNIALLSLAYGGSYTKYADGAEYKNVLVAFTGKITGTLTTLTAEGMYGIKFGMIRTF